MLPPPIRPCYTGQAGTRFLARKKGCDSGCGKVVGEAVTSPGDQNSFSAMTMAPTIMVNTSAIIATAERNRMDVSVVRCSTGRACCHTQYLYPALARRLGIGERSPAAGRQGEAGVFTVESLPRLP